MLPNVQRGGVVKTVVVIVVSGFTFEVAVVPVVVVAVVPDVVLVDKVVVVDVVVVVVVVVVFVVEVALVLVDGACATFGDVCRWVLGLCGVF